MRKLFSERMLQKQLHLHLPEHQVRLTQRAALSVLPQDAAGEHRLDNVQGKRKQAVFRHIETSTPVAIPS